ncbi:MAG TPA: hypothetical protein VK439_14765 [Rubrivivax sp.]|nr:hypothetical protein [Rubrivivax sp.]
MMKVRLHACRHALGTLVAGLSLAACAANQVAPLPDGAAHVSQLIGKAACTADTDCATIGVGAMACGGPQAYVAWSRKETDGQALAAAVARQREERVRQIARTGEQSVCVVVPDPGARCSEARRCELRQGGGGGGAAVR